MNDILFTFPGQGAQAAGMLHELAESVPCRTRFDEAGEALGEDILSLDTEEALQRTRAVQLCLLVAGVISSDWFLRRGVVPDFVSGLSIGAFPAAVAAGALTFPDAVRLVALRGELMERAYPSGYGLSSIGGLPQKEVEKIVDTICTTGQAVYLANLNATDQFVIAGSKEAMQLVLQKACEKGATRVETLSVAVPSHCPLLNEAAQTLLQAARQISFKRPAIAYLSGSTGRVLWQPERIADDLVFNMARPVRWADAMTAAGERGVRLIVEMPPGSVLTGLARRVMAAGEAVSCQQVGFETVSRLARRLKETCKRSESV